MVAVIHMAYILVTEGYENSFRVARNDTKRAKEICGCDAKGKELLM